MKNTFKKLCAIFVIAVMLLPMLAVNVSAATYIWPLDSYNNYITSYAGNRIHPITGEELYFESDLPVYFQEFIRKLH